MCYIDIYNCLCPWSVLELILPVPPILSELLLIVCSHSVQIQFGSSLVSTVRVLISWQNEESSKIKVKVCVYTYIHIYTHIYKSTNIYIYTPSLLYPCRYDSMKKKAG